MVVLSSGTLGTPQILERSGVGNGELLRQLGVKVVSDLPGVGEEYQDHYTTLSRESGTSIHTRARTYLEAVSLSRLERE